jgi:hypothetical protein
LVELGLPRHAFTLEKREMSIDRNVVCLQQRRREKEEVISFWVGLQAKATGSTLPPASSPNMLRPAVAGILLCLVAGAFCSDLGTH